DPADLAVVEPDVLPRSNVRENLRKGARDGSGAEERAVVGVMRRSPGSRGASDEKPIAGLEHQESRIRRELADPGHDRRPLVATAQLDRLRGIQVRRLVGPRPAASLASLLHGQAAFLTA